MKFLFFKRLPVYECDLMFREKHPIRRDHVLVDLLYKGRIFFQKLIIPFLCCSSQRKNYALTLGHETFLQSGLKRSYRLYMEAYKDNLSSKIPSMGYHGFFF